MGNSQSKDSPYYATAGITGAAGGVLGAAAVCVCIFSLPLSLSVAVIGGTAGLAAGLVTEHVLPSSTYAEAGLKGGVIGFIAGGSVYYMSVKVVPDIVLSQNQLNCITERAQKIATNPNSKPTKLIWEKNAPTYVEQYKIKDPKTAYVVSIDGQPKNALKIDFKYNSVSGVPKRADINHTYLEISDGKQSFITELSGPVKGAKCKTGVNIDMGTREGIVFDTYYADPNKCRTIKQAKELVTQVKKPWDETMVYNFGDGTCQHYCQDTINVLTNVPTEQIILKEKNTFSFVQAADNFTGKIFDGNSTEKHATKNDTLQNIRGHPPQLKSVSNDVPSVAAKTAALFGGVYLCVGVAIYKAIQKRRRRERV
eukprot:244957_1